MIETKQFQEDILYYAPQIVGILGPSHSLTTNNTILYKNQQEFHPSDPSLFITSIHSQKTDPNMYLGILDNYQKPTQRAVMRKRGMTGMPTSFTGTLAVMN